MQPKIKSLDDLNQWQRIVVVTHTLTSRGAVAQSIKHPSKGPGSRYNSTDVGSNPSAAA